MSSRLTDRREATRGVSPGSAGRHALAQDVGAVPQSREPGSSRQGATMQNERLSSDEACAYASVTERTLRKWATRGLVERFAGPSGRPTYQRDQLDQALARNKRAPRPEDDSTRHLGRGTQPQNMHEAASQAQTQGEQAGLPPPQIQLLLDRALQSTAHAEHALTQALEEIRWLKERVEASEREREAASRERAELLRLLLADREDESAPWRERRLRSDG